MYIKEKFDLKRVTLFDKRIKYIKAFVNTFRFIDCFIDYKPYFI